MSPCYPSAKDKTNDFNPMPVALYVRGSGVQNISNHLRFQHNIRSFFIHCYTKTVIISSVQGHNDQHPDNQFVKTSSQRWCCTFKSPNTSVQKTVSFLRISDLHPMSRTSSPACNTHTTSSNKSPWLIKGLSKHNAYSPWY